MGGSRSSGADAVRVSVLVCRGCCCGTAAKHPSIDHDDQLHQLRAAADEGGARLWTVDCLGPCERSNVVVVRSGQQRRWFGSVLDEATTSALAGWVRTGALSSPPEAIGDLEFSPDDSSPVVADDLPIGRSLVDLLRPAFERGAAVVTSGSHGAIAEVRVDQGATVGVADLRLRVEQTDASIELDLGHPRLRALGLRIAGAPHGEYPMVVLAVASDAPEAGSGEVRCLGPDIDAFDDTERSQVLYDLGIGHAAARFCVRAADRDLEPILAGVAGRVGVDALDEIGGALVELSPTRVVISPIGRVEISAPIPHSTDAPPDGPHTHVSREHLALGLAGPPELALPEGLVPVAIIYLGPTPT